MAHAWKACWVQALGGSNPPSSATGPRDRFRFRGFCCLQPRLISGRREFCPPASRPRRVLLLVVPLVFWAPSGPAAREIATRELRSARRLEARPCPPGPPAPSTPAALVSLGLARPGPAAAHRHRGQALRTLRRPPRRRRLWCCVYRPAIGGVTALLSPGLVPLDSEAFDDLCTRERGQDLARHKELRAAQARADAAPSDRARRVDEEPP